MTTYIPFTYLIGWSKHNIWYYGVRVKPGTTPADLWTTYFTSSKLVKQIRKDVGEPDVIQVRKTFKTKTGALLWEHKVLRRLNVKKQPLWLNVSVGLGDNHHIGPHSCESIEKMKRSHQRKFSSGFIPTKHTEEYKQKLREHNPGSEATAKPVQQIDPVSGAVVATWPSTRQAGLSLDIRVWRNISRSASAHKTRTVGGFYWRWVGDSDVVDGYLIDVQTINERRLDRSLKAGRSICQIDPTTQDIITTWKNQSEVARHLGITSAAISSAIKNGTQCAGYVWRKSCH